MDRARGHASHAAYGMQTRRRSQASNAGKGSEPKTEKGFPQRVISQGTESDRIIGLGAIPIRSVMESI